VAGSNLKISIKQTEGVQFGSSGPLRVQKATPSGLYRQQLSVTRASAGTQSLRVLVTMDMGEGVAFGYYSIPFTSGERLLRNWNSVKHTLIRPPVRRVDYAP
jgi:hypothetical protein